MIRYLPFILLLALTIYAFIDCLNTPEDEVKHLPKVAWVVIILLFSIVGPVVWLVAGRPRGGRRRAGGPASPWQRRGGSGWVAPDDNPEFLRSLGRQQDEGRPAEDGEAEPRRRGEEHDRPEDGDGTDGGTHPPRA